MGAKIGTVMERLRESREEARGGRAVDDVLESRFGLELSTGEVATISGVPL